MSTFQIFPNFGHQKSNFSQIQNSPHYPRGGQENYGLFPQFVTFHVWKAPLIYWIDFLSDRNKKHKPKCQIKILI